jgi:hypothetical protein
MGYNIIASKIRTETSLIENSIGGINGLSFDSVWSGEAHNTLISNLNSCVNNISSQNGLIKKYADILDELQKYKDNKEKISSLNTSLSNLSNDEANNSRRNEIRSSISSLDKTNNAIRATINSFISSLTSYSTSFSKIDCVSRLAKISSSNLRVSAFRTDICYFIFCIFLEYKKNTKPRTAMAIIIKVISEV